MSEQKQWRVLSPLEIKMIEEGLRLLATVPDNIDSQNEMLATLLADLISISHEMKVR